MVMKHLKRLLLLLLVAVSVACQKNQNDYQPPTKGNVNAQFFIETTWNVQENTVSIPFTLNDFCMKYLKKIYFGTQTCILTAQYSREGGGSDKREYKGTYRVVNVNATETLLYLDNLIHGRDTCSYKLSFDEINTGHNGTSLVIDLIEGNRLPALTDGGNYGSFRLSK